MFIFGFSKIEETRKKLSEAAKGRPASILCKQKSTERINIMWEEIRAGTRKHPWQNKSLSPEHRKKLSEVAKRRQRGN